MFNPVINSNYKYISLDFFLNNYQKKINIGDYIPKDAYLRANLYLNNNVDEPAEFTFNGVSIGYSRSIAVDTAFNIPVLGNGNISNGNITLSIPFINKGIMFNQSDLETFRQLLTK